MSTYAVNRCHHIRMNGTQCGSPAMRTERFCFFHLNTSPLNCEMKSPDLRDDDNFVLPVLEDATSIQLAISQVVSFLLRGYISDRRARVLLYACKLASQNLKRMETEKPLPTQMLVDVRTIPTTPMGASDLWSETVEAPDSSEDPGQEPTAPQTQNAQPTAREQQLLEEHRRAPTFRDRLPCRPSAAGLRAEKEAIQESLDRAAEEARNHPQADKPTGALPPGTIQACQERRRKEYVI